MNTLEALARGLFALDQHHWHVGGDFESLRGYYERDVERFLLPALATCPCGCPADMHIGEIGCPCGLPGEPPCTSPTPPADLAAATETKGA